MSASAHIRLLPEHVINKIAAGEVVERPASVLKELMENALDAGATQVDVAVAVGGRKLVAVSDNGAGMSRDDALLSVERHATSKIRDADDIERIATLGFRGEALAAIAAVARFRLVTGRAGEPAGTELLIIGGKIQDVRDLGGPPGTSVEVRDLFFNVPARRRFLRAEQTELAHLRADFMIQALSHPAVGMTLKVDGAALYALAGGALADRIRDLFGVEYVGRLRAVAHAAQGISLRGFAGLPALSRADRNEQYLFVNGRATGAPLIAFSVREAYRTLVPAGRHPAVFLFLDMDPARVDVNVHPAKREVRFREPGAVRDTLIEALRQALAAEGLPRPGSSAPSAAALSPSGLRPATTAQLRIEDLPPARAFRYPRLPAEGGAGGAAATTDDGGRTAEALGAGQSSIGNLQSSIATPSAPWSWCRVLGQIGSLYVVLETEEGLVLMDPHAAHERVLFERFMAEVLRGEVKAQSSLIPETVHLQPRDAARVRKTLPLLRDMGFGIAEFGGDSFVVDALPPCLAEAAAETLLIEISHGLEQAGARGGKERWQEESIAQAACKAAVKARDRLRLEEIEQLVVDLARAEMPYTCPHGRPTLIFTSFRELNRKFGRE